MPFGARTTGIPAISLLARRRYTFLKQSSSFRPQVACRGYATPIAPSSRGLWAKHRFGIELECYLPTVASLPQAAKHLASDAQRYVVTDDPSGRSRCTSFSPAGVRAWFTDPDRHTCLTNWVLQQDASLHDRKVGLPVEVSSPVLQWSSGKDSLRNMSRALKALDARITQTCGFHVHLDTQFLSAEVLRQFVLCWIKLEPLLLAAVPPSRRGGEFCLSITDSLTHREVKSHIYAEVPMFRWFLKKAFNPNGKYHAINLPCKDRPHNTLEIRLHSGTVEEWKITRWLKFCLQLLDSCMAPETRPRKGVLRRATGLQMLNLLVDEDVRSHILRRALHFARKYPDADARDEVHFLRSAARHAEQDGLRIGDWREYHCWRCGDLFPSEMALSEALCRKCAEGSHGGLGLDQLPPRGWPVNVCSCCGRLYPSKALFWGSAGRCRACA